MNRTNQKYTVLFLEKHFEMKINQQAVFNILMCVGGKLSDFFNIFLKYAMLLSLNSIEIHVIFSLRFQLMIDDVSIVTDFIFFLKTTLDLVNC